MGDETPQGDATEQPTAGTTGTRLGEKINTCKINQGGNNFYMSSLQRNFPCQGVKANNSCCLVCLSLPSNAIYTGMRRHLFCIIALVLRIQRVFCSSLSLLAFLSFLFLGVVIGNKSIGRHQPQVAETMNLSALVFLA